MAYFYPVFHVSTLSFMSFKRYFASLPAAFHRRNSHRVRVTPLPPVRYPQCFLPCVMAMQFSRFGA